MIKSIITEPVWVKSLSHSQEDATEQLLLWNLENVIFHKVSEANTEKREVKGIMIGY